MKNKSVYITPHMCETVTRLLQQAGEQSWVLPTSPFVPLRTLPVLLSCENVIPSCLLYFHH